MNCPKRFLSLVIYALADVSLMEDFHHAGGLRALLVRIRDLLNLHCITVTGHTLGEEIAGGQSLNDEIIRTRENPLGQRVVPVF